MASGPKRQASQGLKLATKRSKSVSVKAVAADDDADEGDASRAQARAIVQRKKASDVPRKDWPRAFREDVKEDEKNILAYLENHREKIRSEQLKFENDLIPIFRQALLPLEAAEADGEVTGDKSRLKVQFTAIGQQTYGDRIADLVDDSHRLTAQYDKLSRQQPTKSRLNEIKTTFEKDKQGALAMIAAGTRVAATDIQNMLADRHHEVRGRSAVTREEESKGRHLLSQGQPESVDAHHGVQGWGNMAAEVKKAVAKLDQVSTRE